MHCCCSFLVGLFWILFQQLRASLARVLGQGWYMAWWKVHRWRVYGRWRYWLTGALFGRWLFSLLFSLLRASSPALARIFLANFQRPLTSLEAYFGWFMFQDLRIIHWNHWCLQRWPGLAGSILCLQFTGLARDFYGGFPARARSFSKGYWLSSEGNDDASKSEATVWSVTTWAGCMETRRWLRLCSYPFSRQFPND